MLRHHPLKNVVLSGGPKLLAFFASSFGVVGELKNIHKGGLQFLSKFETPWIIPITFYNLTEGSTTQGPKMGTVLGQM